MTDISNNQNVEENYTFNKLKEQVKALLDLRDSNRVSVIEKAREISLSYLRERNETDVGIRLHYNKSFEYLTSDTKSTIVEKAIDNVEVLLKTRMTNSGRKFKESSYSGSLFFTQITEIAKRLARANSVSTIKPIKVDFLNVVLGLLSSYNGIDDYAKEHPLWTVSARNVAIRVSVGHYEKAHHLTKMYGFSSCSVLMSFAMSEYMEALKMKNSMMG